MKDEIKEIITRLKKENRYMNSRRIILCESEISTLLNYITNLQEENKKLKELCNAYEEEHNNEFQCWKRDRKELLDKRARIDKAIEKLESIRIFGLRSGKTLFSTLIDESIDILEGEDKE